MATVTIYEVDAVIQAYAKETSTGFKKLDARYKRLIRGKRFITAFPNYGTDITLVESHGWGSYAYTHGGHALGRAITLGANRDESTLLHEIAHHVAARHRARYGIERGHGTGFALALLDVVKVAQGAEAERALRHAYRALGVRVHKAGSKRGVMARAQGEPPERAREVIARIVDRRDRAARERGIARTMVRARGERMHHDAEGWSYGFPTYATTCPLCQGPGRVTAARRTRTTQEWTAECEPCGVAEVVRLSREAAAS